MWSVSMNTMQIWWKVRGREAWNGTSNRKPNTNLEPSIIDLSLALIFPSNEMFLFFNFLSISAQLINIVLLLSSFFFSPRYAREFRGNYWSDRWNGNRTGEKKRRRKKWTVAMATGRENQIACVLSHVTPPWFHCTVSRRASQSRPEDT